MYVCLYRSRLWIELAAFIEVSVNSNYLFLITSIKVNIPPKLKFYTKSQLAVSS